MEPINYDAYVLSMAEKRKYYGATIVILFCLGYVFYHDLVLALALAALSRLGEGLYIKYKIKKRRDGLEEAFRDLLYCLSASIDSGRQMADAIIEAYMAMETIYDEQAPIMRELALMKHNIQEKRISEEVLLKDFAKRSGINDIISFANVYATCRETGASVPDIIRKSSDMIMDKMAIMKEIKVLTSQKMAEAKLISCMPLVIVVFLNLVSPGYLDSMYSTITGKLIMTVALGMIGFAYYLMNKISEVTV